MRISYSDPLEELKILLKAAKEANNKNCFITISKQELRACLSHKDAALVFVEYTNTLGNQLNQYKERKDKIKKALDQNKDLDSITRQELFDQEDTLDLAIHEAKSNIPTEMVVDGILIKVTMTG